jgi:hypothetical protein
MAITTLDGIIAGAKPPIHFIKTTGTMEAAAVPHSLAYAGGMPGPAVAPTSALAGDALTSYAGQLPMPSFANNTYLMKFCAASYVTGGTLILIDRLWHNAGIDETQTTAQTINSAAWPARDITGTTNGAGVMIGIEVSTATSSAAVTNTTMEYTNSAGTPTRTATIPSTTPGGGFPATAVAGTFVSFSLQAGDVGVRSIQTLTLGTSYGGGEIHLVAYRVLAMLDSVGGALGGSQDMVQCGFPRLYDNTVPFLLWNASATTSTQIQGEIIVTQG